MSARRDDRLGFASVLSHLGVMVAVSAVMGVLVAGLAIPFAGVAGLGARSVAEGMDNLPADLTAEPLAAAHPAAGPRRQPAGHLLRPEPGQRPPRAGGADHAEGDHRDRGLPVLRARRPRPQGHAARVHHQPGRRRRRPGRVLDHPADGEDDPDQPGRHRRGAGRGARRTPTSASSTSCATRSRSRRSTTRTGSSSATSTSPTSATARTASRPPPGTTSPRSAAKLTLPQAALLAGLVKNPTGYDPTNDKDEARERRDVVLDRMAELNVISALGGATAPPSSGPRPRRRPPPATAASSSTAPFFCDYMREYLLADEDLGQTVEAREQRLLNAGGLTIKTTIDPRFQRAADNVGAPTTCTRPTGPSAGWRWSSPAPARCGRWRSRGRWAADKKKGRDLPQLRGPAGVRRRQRLPGRLDVQGVRARGGDQAGHLPVHPDQRRRRRCSSRSNRLPHLRRQLRRARRSGRRRTPPGPAPSTSTPAPSSR